MFQILKQKCSDLVNRRVYYLPFSRDLEPVLSTLNVDLYLDLLRECAAQGGILLTLPEHILSFKLMGIDTLIQEKTAVAQAMANGQNWLVKHARDILDECDEILDPKYQLVYTVGTATQLENSPCRWTIVQEVLELTKTHAIALARESPLSFDIVYTKETSFPVIRVLREEAGNILVKKVVQDICEGRLAMLPIRLLRHEQVDQIKRFLTKNSIEKDIYDNLMSSCSTMKSQLLQLRGLLADGRSILLFALKEKRFRVDYGLKLSRCQLAIPFRCKGMSTSRFPVYNLTVTDVPAPKAEFGHPDVVIILSCLSYYYTGLSDSQMETCFTQLQLTSNPELEYGHWIAKIRNLPVSLSKLCSLNLEDKVQCRTSIFPILRDVKSVIDFYLSRVVFPAAAREFPHKISTSGWDIVDEKPNPVTGFSGTNDNRFLLPTSIQQHMAQNQLHTNALVLQYLLREENSMCVLANTNGKRMTVNDLLNLVITQTPRVKVLLDVGAQVLEMDNLQVAKTWLGKESNDVEGAVYFDARDELMIVKRDGLTERFATSSLAVQLDHCVVYLDEAHTRGTDLKLPFGTRAVVTLGPKLSKDKLVQGMDLLMFVHDILTFKAV